MYQKYVNDPDQWEQMKSISMLAFLCVHGHSQFDVSLENFKLILNIHFAIECNSFGVSNQMWHWVVLPNELHQSLM
jgi:hypothetical protein